MRPGGHLHLLRSPESCIGWLNEQCYPSTVEVSLVASTESVTVLSVQFADDLDEEVRIIVRYRTMQVFAVPIGPEHPWLHRNTRFPVSAFPKHRPICWENILGSLCLWDNHDPEALRWRWQDGLDAFIWIVNRHLRFEKWWRANGYWPAEDSPHGPPNGRHHPIRSTAIEQVAA